MGFKARMSVRTGIGWVSVLTLLFLTVGLIPLFFGFTSLGAYDFTVQQIPFIIETKRMFSSGVPWWSWNTFIGDNFIGAYGFYTLTSPFVWFVCLFPMQKIMTGILISFYLKSLCTSIIAYLYFVKMQIKPQISIVGALLYCFSSFYICNLYYFHFAEPMMVFPILLIGIECVVRKDNNCYVKLALASFVIAFINFYFAISSFLIGFLYFLFRMTDLRLGFGVWLKVMGSVFLGIAISSVVLLPVVFHVIDAPRASIGGVDFQLQLKWIAANYLPMLKSLFFPAISDYFPMDSLQWGPMHLSREAFITMFGWLPAAVYVFKRFNWPSKFLVFLLIVYFTPLNGIFTLYSNPYYCRWLYGMLFVGILVTLYVLQEGIKISSRQLLIYLSVITGVGLLILIYSLASDYKDERAFYIGAYSWMAIALTVLNIVCLVIWVYNREKYKLLLGMIGLCGSLNLMAFVVYGSNDSLLAESDNRRVFKSLLFEEPFETIERGFTARHDDLVFYANEGMLHDRPGIYSFHSIFNNKLIPFRRQLDYDVGSPSFSNLRDTRTSVAALFSVKDVRDYRGYCGNRIKIGLRLVNKTPSYDLYSFDYYIPIGFSYDSFVTDSDLEKAKTDYNDDIDVPLMMLDNLVISEADRWKLSPYLRQGFVNPGVSLDTVVAKRRSFTASDFVGSTHGFKAKTDFNSPRVLFFSVVADPGFTAYIDDKKTDIFNVNLGMSAIMVPKGEHTVRFEYVPTGLLPGCIVSSIALIIFLLVGVTGYRKKQSSSV